MEKYKIEDIINKINNRDIDKGLVGSAYIYNRNEDVREAELFKNNDETLYLEMTLTSEYPVPDFFGTLVLDHSPTSIVADRLINGASFNDGHSGDQVGTIVNYEVTKNRKLKAGIVFSPHNPRAILLYKDYRDKIRKNTSARFYVRDIILEKTINGVDQYRATKWEFIHGAVVSDGADPTVGMDRNLNTQLNNNKPKENKMENVVETRENKLGEQEVAALTAQIKKDLSADKQAAVDRALQEGGEKALLNVAGILTMVRDFKDKVKGVDLVEIGNDFAFRLKADQGEFQKLIIRNLAEQTTVTPKLGMGDHEVKKFSFRNLILSQDPKSGVKADFEIEACREFAKKISAKPQGMLIPTDILLRERTLVTSSATAGGNLVGDNLLPANFIEMVRNKAVSDQLGVLTLDGLDGDVLIPKQTGAGTFSWMSSEVSGPSASDATVGQVSLTPKMGSSNTSYSRKLLLQSTPSIDALVENDLARIAALGEDLAFFHGTGSSGQPTGIANVSGIGGGVKASIDLAGVVSLETDVAVANLDASAMYYVTNATIRGLLKTREKVSGYPQFIWEGNQMNGYPCKVSNQISSGFIFFGDFSQAIKARWNGLDIVVDPYSQSTNGYIKVTVFIYVDVGVRNAGAFAVATSVS